jgi:PAS domain-containing protein/DNA-binding CsgD family transcriptional regulator
VNFFSLYLLHCMSGCGTVSLTRWGVWMRSSPAKHVVESIFDAAHKHVTWAAALDAVADYVGAVGAAYIVLGKKTGRVESASFVGPSAELKAEYVNHYASLDPFSPLVLGAADEGWMALSEVISPARLHRDEWYQDFVVKAGVEDIVGTHLFEDASSTVIFGVHREARKGPFPPACLAGLTELLQPLRMAARVDLEMRQAGWKASIASQALDQFGSGMIIADEDGRVIETNRAAERILVRKDGLTIRGGRLKALQAADDAKLGSLLAAVAAAAPIGASIRRMFIGRFWSRAYLLTISRIPEDLAPYGRWSSCPTPTPPSQSRLAAALIRGKKLRDVSADFGVQVTTLRTQLSSILKKLGAKTQADLIRICSNIPINTKANRDG